MKKLLALLVTVALGLGIGFAVGQSTLISTTLNGNETWVVALGGPGGPSLFTNSAQMRTSQGVSVIAATSGSVQLGNNIADIIFGATVSGALTVSSPSIPWDGEIFEMINGSGSNNTATATFAGFNASQTVVAGGVAALANQSSAEWRYSQASATWFRLR
jgi:hypothetical protein